MTPNPFLERTRRRRTRRALGVMVSSLVVVVAACESADLITPQPCRGDLCTCEQDPQQLRCRGFSPEGGTFDAPETPTQDAAESGADAASDAEASIEDADAG